MLVSDELEQKYYTFEEAMREVGVSEATLREDIKKARIQAYRFKGHKNWYKKEDIEKLKAERNRIRPVE